MRTQQGDRLRPARTSDKARGAQTKARLAAFATHPLHQKTTHQFGFVMLTEKGQAEMDADHAPRTTGLSASKKGDRPS